MGQEIELTIHEDQVEKTIQRCRERRILIPTFEQMRDPSKVPRKVRDRLPGIGLWDVDHLNLFRINWKNDPETGTFHCVNAMEIPPELSGVESRIFALVGKFFPTGAHKVGATFGTLAPRLVTGTFNPVTQKAVWPSTGNYCRGGAYVGALLGCKSIAILPEEMSRERFDWLRSVGAEVIATPGCESNVKEIYDKCWELRRTRPDAVILNQFDEFGNPMWHYQVTGPAIEEVLAEKAGKAELFAYVSATGSAGTIAAGDHLKKLHPTSKIVAAEALQCPTLLYNGYGGHRIEGIGDKHVPWVHNVRNTDMVLAVDDESTIRLMRLFNEPEGKKALEAEGVDPGLIEDLPLLGISSIGNLVASIKVAKYYELTSDDVVFTIFTDSMEMYGSRLREQNEAHGPYTATDAQRDIGRYLFGLGTDHMLELGYRDRRRIHNLKYFTWIEQQGKDISELNAQWYDRGYFDRQWQMADRYDRLIEAFNERSGVLDEL